MTNMRKAHNDPELRLKHADPMLHLGQLLHSPLRRFTIYTLKYPKDADFNRDQGQQVAIKAKKDANSTR